MSEFLGSTISLISKSDIRYVGVLHEINSEESTVSLENVRSWGTEGRKGNPEEEIPPSVQVYEYIVFRGSDVKDLRIEDGPGAKEEKPAAVPDDPAIIVGARARPSNGPAPGGPAPFGQNPWGGNNFYPQMNGWGRGGIGPGPGPGPGPGGFYPPPHGWMSPGQFPPGPGGPGGPGGPVGPGGPGGPGPWNNNFGAFPPGPPGPPGMPGGGPGMPAPPGQMNRPGSDAPGPSELAGKPGPIGVATNDKKPAPGPQTDIPSEPKSLGQGSAQQAKRTPPTLPTETKPSVEEVKSTAAALTPSKPAGQPTIPTGPSASSAPTAPKAVRPVIPIIPAVPKFIPPVSATTPKTTTDRATPGSTAAAIRDATQAARAAVAVAMSKMEQHNSPPPQNGAGSAMDNLTKKVNEMRVNAAARGGPIRGRGRGGRHPAAKVEVPDVDFDFASSNAKFNKEELVKAAGPVPVPEGASISQSPEPNEAGQPPAYNKKASFFDNISSEAKERAQNGGQKPGGREWRGEEQRRNIETFGSPSVDNGYRSTFRRGGRGRGGIRGRGYRGGGGRGGGGNRPLRETQGI